MVLYLYSAFLVLITTPSTLQYSFTFTHSHTHTHSYSASITSTLLFYRGLFGIQHLAQGHFGMQIWKTGYRTADLQVGGRPLYPSATAAPVESEQSGSVVSCDFPSQTICSYRVNLTRSFLKSHSVCPAFLIE